MKLVTKALEQKLPALYSTDGQGDEAIVHAKFFTPDASWTWYATEYDPVERTAFGWAINAAMPDCAELGYFSLGELESGRGPLGLPIERDKWFQPGPLSQIRERCHRRPESTVIRPV